METKRQKQVARLVQKELGYIFQADTKGHFNGSFITVTSLKITPDLSIARVYLSFINSKNKQALLEDIRNKGKLIRHHLALRMGKQLRIIPELQFHLDDSADYAEKMDDLFSKIEIPPADKDYKIDSDDKEG
ncbi:MAG: 30S ribosome-binding factor RbfA [Thermonemataceae bacterium]